MVGVDPHVLRYWESEFPLIRPHRGRSRQRLYRRRDVENLLRIRTLLHDEGYTISGARKVLRNRQGQDRQGSLPPPPRIEYIKNELKEILEIIGGEKKENSRG